MLLLSHTSSILAILSVFYCVVIIMSIQRTFMYVQMNKQNVGHKNPEIIIR